MPTGTVTWFNPTTGYGLITPEPGGDVCVSCELEQRRQGKTVATSLKAL
jgi:cold shock CspA family protein